MIAIVFGPHPVQLRVSISLVFAGARGAGEHPLSLFVSRQTKVTGRFLLPSPNHRRLHHGCPKKNRRRVPLLPGFWFLHPVSPPSSTPRTPALPASTQTGRSGPDIPGNPIPQTGGGGAGSPHCWEGGHVTTPAARGRRPGAQN